MLRHQNPGSLENVSEECADWGEWAEQDITEGSEEWVEDQRKKQQEVAQVIEEREKKALELEEKERQEPEHREQDKSEKSLDEILLKLDQLFDEFIKLNQETEEKQLQRGKTNHLFFASHESKPEADAKTDTTEMFCLKKEI